MHQQRKQIGLAVHNYHDAHSKLPYSQIGDYDSVFPGATAKFNGFSETSRSWSWLARLLPYLPEMNNVSTAGDIPISTLAGSGVIATRVPAFLYPSDGGTAAGVIVEQSRYMFPTATAQPVGVTNYKGVMGDTFFAGPWFNTSSEYSGYDATDPWCCGNGIIATDWARRRISNRSSTAPATHSWPVKTSTTTSQHRRAPAQPPLIGWGYAWVHPYETVRSCAIPPNNRRMPPQDPDDRDQLSGFKSMHPGASIA